MFLFFAYEAVTGGVTATGPVYGGRPSPQSFSDLTNVSIHPWNGPLPGPGGLAVAFRGTQRLLDHRRCTDLPVTQLPR